MDNESPKIACRDWRIHGIALTAEDFVTPDGKKMKAGSVVEMAGFVQLDKEVISFPVPNPVALYISLARKAGTKGKAAIKLLKHLEPSSGQFKRLKNEDEEIFFDGIEQLVACVIFSYSALEAFANISLPNEFSYQRPRGDKKCTEVFSRDQVERYLSLSEKLDKLLPQVFDIVSPKGTSSWQKFVDLQRLRDRFVHLKFDDWQSVSKLDNLSATIWTQLLATDVPHIYRTSIDLISYFCQNSYERRWLSKIKDKIDNES